MHINRTNWKTRWQGLRDANSRNEASVSAAGMIYVNPYDYLGSIFPHLSSETETTDGVHYEGQYALKLVNKIAGLLPRRA